MMGDTVDPGAPSLIGQGTWVLDAQGRVWCMLGRHGFTHQLNGWWHGSPRDGLTLAVTNAATVDALDAWAAASVWPPDRRTNGTRFTDVAV